MIDDLPPPRWDDGLPRLHALGVGHAAALASFTVGVVVPGGALVGAFASEVLAREFVGSLGERYAAIAADMFRDLDERVRVIGAVADPIEEGKRRRREDVST